MIDKSRHLGPALLILVACLVAVSYALLRDGAADGAGSGGRCISDEREKLSSGTGPSGRPWRIIATVRNNNGCDAWLLGAEFVPSGSSPGSWRGAWAIPAGGHLSANFAISARDDAQVAGRSVSGITGADVQSIVFTSTKGKHLTAEPKLPPQSLRQNNVWLRNLRYVIAFYPSGESLKKAKLLDRNGEVLTVVRAAEGAFEELDVSR
jgi:hypothetical protein